MAAVKHKPSLLYVDDNQELLFHFEELFQDEYMIYTAKTREEAIDIIEKEDIKILLTDYMLDEHSGIDILKHVLTKYPSIIRLIITGYRDLDVIEEAINKGSVHGFLKKPINESEIKIVIKNAYERHYLKETNLALMQELGEIVEELKVQKRELNLQIEEKKQAEELAKYFRSILDHTDDLSVIKDLNHKWIACNKSVIKICGKNSMDELVGKNDIEIFGDHPRVRQYMEDDLTAQKLKKGENFEKEEIVVSHDGKIMHNNVLKFPIYNENDELIATASIARNLSERIVAEEKIKKLNEELETRVKQRTKELEETNSKLSDEIRERLLAQSRLLMMEYSIDNSATPTFWIDTNGSFIYTNLAAKKLLKQNSSKTYDYKYFDISEQWEPELWDKQLHNIKKNKTIHYEDTYRRMDGSNVAVDVTISYFLFEGSDYLFAYANDISERKQAETELRKLYSAVEYSQATILITDVQGGIQYVNPKFTETSGYTKEEVLGKNPRFLKAGELPASVYKDLWERLSSGKEWRGNLCNKKKTGEIYWEQVLISPVLNKKNEITHYVGVKEDITERLKSAEELQAAKDKADAASIAKSEFLANMSHEIRTPMNAVLGFAELLANQIKNEQQKNYLDSIMASGKTLLTIINDILDISKIEAGKLNLKYNYISTHSFFEEIQTIFSLKIHQKGLEFILDIDPQLPKAIYLDELRLRQILLNLVGNAIKFTEKGYIKLSITGNNKNKKSDSESKEFYDLMIDVEDTGIGISDDFVHKVFDSFTQQDEKNVNHAGTGLGLAISKRLTEMMGGSISVTSERGKGSIFNIYLPDIKISRKDDHIKTETDDELVNPDEITFNKSKIIVVDDIDSNRNYLASALKNTNLEIYEANNGNVALTIAEKIKPDLIITDVKMPEMDGFQLINEIRKKPFLKDVIVIAASASVMRMTKEKAKEYSFNGFIMKPIKVGTLYSELAKFLPHQIKSKVKKTKKKVQYNTSSLSEKERQIILTELNKKFSKTWEGFKDQQPMDEVEKFGHNLIELGKKYDCDPIKDFGSDLISAVNNFDIDLILDTLNKYPILLKNLK